MWRQLPGRAANLLARAVVLATLAITVILAIHIIFVVFKANPHNSIVSTMNDWGSTLAWKFHDMFTPSNPRTATFVNDGLAAVIYLVAGGVVARLIRRLG